MSIQRTPSIINLETTALICDRIEHEGNDPNESLAESAKRFSRITDALIAFSSGFCSSFKNSLRRRFKSLFINSFT